MLPKFRPIINRPIPLGRKGENLARRIDFTDIVEMMHEIFGEGTCELRYQRPQDTQAYIPSVIIREGDTLTWKPTSTDLAHAGKGRCELRWIVDGKVAKSRVWDCIVEDSIVEDGHNPDEHEYYDGAYVVTPAWVEQTLETDEKICSDNIRVLEIQAMETHNPAGGLTLSI